MEINLIDELRAAAASGDGHPYTLDLLERVAQRLESLSQVTEEEVEAARKAYERAVFQPGNAPMRAALEAARKART